MKKFVVVLLVLLFAGHSYSQMFMPLQQGNIWKYKYSETYGDCGPVWTFTTYYYYSDVDGNFIIQGKPYHKIINIKTGTVVGYCRLREDGYFVYRLPDGANGYSAEACYYKAGMQVGDILPGTNTTYPTTMQFQNDAIIFNMPTIQKGLTCWGSTAPLQSVYSEDFGLVSTFDQGIFQTEYVLLGCTINGHSYGDTTKITSVDEQAASKRSFSLQQNYPNPFNPSTTISYSVAKDGLVQLQVFDILGNQVATLVNEVMPAGEHTTVFTAVALPSGIYLCRLQVGNQVQIRKMSLLK